MTARYQRDSRCAIARFIRGIEDWEGSNDSIFGEALGNPFLYLALAGLALVLLPLEILDEVSADYSDRNRRN